MWTITKRRLAEGGFPGFAIIAQNQPKKKKVGIVFDGAMPVREPATLVAPGTTAKTPTIMIKLQEVNHIKSLSLSLSIYIYIYIYYNHNHIDPNPYDVSM